MANKTKDYRLLPLEYLKSIGRYDKKVMNRLGFPESMQNDLKSKEGTVMKMRPMLSWTGVKALEMQPKRWIVPRNWAVRI